MNLTKVVTSRKGNKFVVDLVVNYNSSMVFEVYNDIGKLTCSGTWPHENDLIKAVKDLVLHVEESYSDYDAVKSFEDWDGTIE